MSDQEEKDLRQELQHTSALHQLSDDRLQKRVEQLEKGEKNMCDFINHLSAKSSHFLEFTKSMEDALNHDFNVPQNRKEAGS